MALDSSGRPIPVELPDPATPQARMTEEQEQFLLIARKIDDALRHLEDLARRVGSLEVGNETRFNAKIFDFEQRFDAMMLARMTDHETRFQLMADTLRQLMEKRDSPPPPLTPASSQ
jgi:hypothetical protein